MDPAIVIFGFGIGAMVGMTGMGGGTLMTPLLIFLFGVKPVTAIGTDIFYAAVTKTVGGWRHLKMGTVNIKPRATGSPLGSVPAAVTGVWAISVLQSKVGEEQPRLDRLRPARRHPADGRDHHPGAGADPQQPDRRARRLRAASAATRSPRSAIGATTGFVIGITSAGSGTVIAILLIAVYRLTPRKVVGTDVFHAAILLWAAGIAHWVGGNVDFVLAGNILLGSIPGRGRRLSLRGRRPTGFLRTALGVVLIASGIVTVQKGDPVVWPIAAAVAGIGLRPADLVPALVERAPGQTREATEQQARDRSDDLAPDVIG